MARLRSCLMENLIIDRDGNSFYPGKRSSQAIGYLGGFLCCDVGSSIDSWREWINDQKSKDVGSNYSHLEKHDNSIFIAFEIDYFNETPDAPVFELSVTQMNYVLDRWKEALEKKPNKIIITKNDNGEIKVDFED